MVFQRLFNGKTEEEVAADRAADERTTALMKEIEAASRGDIAAIEAQIASYEGEVKTLRRDITSTDRRDHQEELARLERRVEDVRRVILPALNRQLRTVREQTCRHAAGTWNRSAETARLISTYCAAKAEQLAPVAALLTSWEGVRTPPDMKLTLPAADVTALQQFEVYVQILHRNGVRVDMKSWPAAVRERCTPR